MTAVNVLGTALEICSLDPLTGFFRDGCCNTCADDIGQHTICVEMTERFLLFSRERGNDLITPQLDLGFPGLLPGDRWCVCLPRWIEAYNEGIVARVHLRATHAAVAATVPMDILEQCALHDALGAKRARAVSATLTHRGSCHCGAIAFEVDAPARLEVEACNCSICSKSAYLHLIVAASRLRVLRGADQLTSYSFNTGTARHTFCRTCGVKPFYVPRSNPSGYSVNVRCLERTHIADIAVEPFDGRDWERHAARLAGKAGEQEPGAGRG